MADWNDSDDGTGWTKKGRGKNKQQQPQQQSQQSGAQQPQKQPQQKQKGGAAGGGSKPVASTTTIYEQFEEIQAEREKKDKEREKHQIIMQKKNEEKEKANEKRKIKMAQIETMKKEEEEEAEKALEEEYAQVLRDLNKAKKTKGKRELPKFNEVVIPEITEVAEQIDIATVSQKTKEWEKKYSTSPNIQLQLLSEYFFETFGQTPSLFAKYHEDTKAGIPAWGLRTVPYSLLDSGVLDFIVEWIKKFNEEEIKEFITFVYDTFVKCELEKSGNHSSTGLWTMLQILSRRFPEMIPDVLERINGLMSPDDSKDTNVYKRKDNAFIFHFLGNVMQSNPKIALSCWFSTFFPTLESGVAKRGDEELIQFLELTVKNKKNFTSSEVSGDDDFSVEDDLVKLLEYIFLKDISSKSQDRLKSLLPNLLDCTVFQNETSPKLYFENLLALASKILFQVSEEDDNGDDKKKSVNFILNTLAVSLVKDPECHVVLIDRYPKYINECSQALINLGSNWDKLTGKINKTPAVLQGLVGTCKTLIGINQQIIDNQYKYKGKVIGPKSVGLKPEAIFQLNQSYKTLLKTLENAAQQAQKQQQQVKVLQVKKKRGYCSSIFLLLFLLLLFIISLFVGIYLKLIPEKYLTTVTYQVPALKFLHRYYRPK